MTGFRRVAETPPVEMLPGVRRQMLAEGEQAMVVRVWIDREAVVPLHTHPHEQVGHLESGRARFQIQDEERELNPGDGYEIPGGVPHGVVALDDCVFVDVFSPPRDEYRQ
ncbi:MAG: cupin domain-containing protein [Chloroflexota bacterium]